MDKITCEKEYNLFVENMATFEDPNIGVAFHLSLKIKELSMAVNEVMKSIDDLADDVRLK